MSDSESASRLREAAQAARGILESAAEDYADSSFAPLFASTEILPVLRQSAEILDQMPPLFEQIAGGAREFTPSPADTRDCCRRKYRARRTLLIQFEDDAIDQSDDLHATLQEAASIMRMKRPLIDMELKFHKVSGTHITPLMQDVFQTPFDGAPVANPLSPVRDSVRAAFLRTADETQQVLVDWLNSGT